MPSPIDDDTSGNPAFMLRNDGMLRFADITVPPGSEIDSAYIQFEADRSNSSVANLTVSVQDADDPPPFFRVRNNISSRSVMAPTMTWNPPAWTA